MAISRPQVISTPAAPAIRDPRFGVVAGFTQICNTAPVGWRRPMLSMLARLGITRYRDFPQMELIRETENSPYTFDREDPAGLSGRMDQLHGLNAELGLEVLDCFVGTPSWNRPNVSSGSEWNRFNGDGRRWGFPRDLGATSDSYAAVAAHWGDTELGIEAWNEEDSVSALPADQYAVLMKAMRHGLDQAAANDSANGLAPVVPLVCGAFTDAVHTAYLNSLCDNQLATVCDAVSYHSYTDAFNVQDDAGRIVLWANACAVSEG